MKKSYYFLTTILVSFFLTSCFEDVKEFVPDVSHLNSNAAVNRFDQAVISLDTNDINKSMKELRNEYPYLTDLYFQKVIALKGKTEEEINANIQMFLTNTITRNLFDTVGIVFSNMDEINTEFQNSFKFFKYYFPDFIEPNLYSVVSEFGYQRFIFEDGDKDGIGIGLDMFLGESFPYKGLDPQNPSFSDYLTRAFNKDHLVKKSMELILDDRLPPPAGVRMMDQMIFNGKKLYLLDKILPFKSDTVIIEYTGEQLSWARENELEMWSFFVDEELLYETNQQKVNKYLNPSPNSPGMPNIAPGRTGNYLGWQIVKAYMNRFPEASLMDMLALTDSQKFLEDSRYRPKK